GLNVTTPLGTLVLVDSEFILGLYANATEPFWPRNVSGLGVNESMWLAETERCRRMFAQIDSIAWHRTCAPTGRLDLLRSFPCQSTGLCAEEDDPNRVLPKSQFTYVVQDLRQPRYWYLSLVSCVRNPITCQWETTRVSRSVHRDTLSELKLVYSVWLVNGAPRLQSYNKFEHQFSFETHDTLEIFLFILVSYFILNVIAHTKLHNHSSVHSHMLLGSLWLSCIGLLLTSIHLTVFSFDGQGLSRLLELGTFSTQWGDALFLALLLSTAEVGFFPVSSAVNIEATKSERWRLPGSRDYSYHALAPGDAQTQPYRTHGRPSNAITPVKPWSFLTSLISLFIIMQTLLYSWAAVSMAPCRPLVV
ncbi:Rhodopsin GPCR transmembrane domain, partial [Fasciolopsis buskii]